MPLSSLERPLSDQRIVVTGASSGIGQATAWALAAQGAHVLAHYHQNQTGAQATNERRPEHAPQIHLHAADLRSESDRLQLIDTAWQWGQGRIDGWIHNAGADVLTGSMKDASFEEKLDLLWAVDVRATILLARSVLDRMRHQPLRPHVPLMLFIGWDQAWEGMEGDAGQMFGSIKGAIMAASKSFAQEASPKVRVNCVAPGWIQTAWGATASPTWQARAKAESLLNRWGQPDDVAQLIAWLCQPAAQFINGQIIPVNGGWKRHR